MKKVSVQIGSAIVSIEGDNAAELFQDLKQAGLLPSANGQSKPASTPTESSSLVESQPAAIRATKPSHTQRDESDAGRFRRLFRLLGEKPRKILAVLMDRAGEAGMTNVELQEAIQPIALAGSMTAISKLSSKCGLDVDKVIQKERCRDRETGAEQKYWIGEVAKTVLEEIRAAEGQPK